MRTLKLGSVIARLVPAALVVGTLGACTVHGRGRAYVSAPSAEVVVYEEPPPPRRVYVAPRPGYVWIEGRWTLSNGHWLWRDGYYVRERPNYAWTPGHWSRRSNGHVYVEGHWRARARGDIYVDQSGRQRVRDYR